MLSTQSNHQLQPDTSSFTAATIGQQKVMLFDLLVGGHHGSYIQHIVEKWLKQEQTAELSLVVSPEFNSFYPDVCQLISEAETDKIKLVAIAPEELAQLNGSSKLDRYLRTIKEWDLLCKYAESLEANHCLIMYFDTSWLPLMLGKKCPCSFSGIYFRPTLHYRHFINYSADWQERLQQWREKLTLARLLKHPQLKNLFCIDPFAPKFITDNFTSHVKLVPLADPVKEINSSQQSDRLKEDLKIPAERQVLLLFGALTGRKGVPQVLSAISLLPSEVCQKISLVMIGEGDRSAIEAQAEAIRQAKPVQIVGHYQFVPEADVAKYFQLADLVLAPYQKHIGMSGILLLAAAAQKPVLSSNYGLMGELVHQYQLGLAVDSTDPEAIAKGITECLSQSPEELGDRQKMLDFATQNSASNFAKTIIEQLTNGQSRLRRKTTE